jgi:hypothetical protein
MSSPISAECNKPLTGQSLKNNTSQLADAMGLNETCKQKANNEFSTGSISGSISIPFAKMSAQAGFTQSNNSMAQSGCGQFFLNAQNMMTSTQNINCTLNSSKSSVSTNASANTKIIFDNTWTPEHAAAQAKLQKLAQEAYDTLITVTIPTLLIKGVPLKTTNALQSAAKENIASYNPPSLNVRNSTIKAVSKMDIKTVNNLEQSLKNQIVDNFKKAATSTATNHIESTLGTGALSPNVKSLIQKNIDDQAENYNNTVNTTLANTNVSSTANNEIKFLSSGEINIEDTTIDSETVVNMATSAIVKNAAGAGITAATNIINDATDSTSSKSNSAGINDLANALANIQEKQEKAPNEGSGFPWYVYLIIGIIVLGIIGGGMYAVKNSDKISKAVQSARGPKIP